LQSNKVRSTALFDEVRNPAKGLSFSWLNPFLRIKIPMLSRPSPLRSFLPENELPTLHVIQPDQIQMIDEALCSLGDYGEVRLVVEKGRLRYLVTQKSLDVLKWQPGTLVKDLSR
jgi:hypothetical protein